MESHRESQQAAETQQLPDVGKIYPWYLVGVLVLMNIFSWLDRQVIVMLIDPIRHDLGITEVQIGLLTGFAFALLYAVCGIPLGWAADRFNRRLIIFFGICFWSLATVSCGYATNFSQLFMSRVCIGVGEAALIPAAFSILADTFPPKRMGLASAFFSSANGVGIALGFTITGLIASSLGQSNVILPLLGEFRPWQVPFIAVGLPGLVLVFLMFTIKEPKRSRLAGHSSSVPLLSPGLFGYLNHHWKFYACHMIGMASTHIGFVNMITWGPVYLMRVFGWTPVEVGAIYGLCIGGSVLVAQIGGGSLVDYFYARGMKDAHLRLYSYAAPVAMVIAVGAILAHNPWIFIAGIVTANTVVMGNTGVGLAAMQIITPNEFRGRMVAIFSFLSTIIGAGLGPLIVAMLTQYVFKDDKAVGWSLLVVFCCIYPLTTLLFRIGAKHMRKIHIERGI